MPLPVVAREPTGTRRTSFAGRPQVVVAEGTQVPTMSIRSAMRSAISDCLSRNCCVCSSGVTSLGGAGGPTSRSVPGSAG